MSVLKSAILFYGLAFGLILFAKIVPDADQPIGIVVGVAAFAVMAWLAFHGVVWALMHPAEVIGIAAGIAVAVASLMAYAAGDGPQDGPVLAIWALASFGVALLAGGYVWSRLEDRWGG